MRIENSEEQAVIIKMLYDHFDSKSKGGIRLYDSIREGDKHKSLRIQTSHLAISFLLDLSIAGTNTWQLRRKKLWAS